MNESWQLARPHQHAIKLLSIQATDIPKSFYRTGSYEDSKSISGSLPAAWEDESKFG